MANPQRSGFQIGGQPDDLFTGAAAYYAQFRRHCPLDVVAHLVDQFQLDGQGRLLDIGCGTGQIFLPLAKYFREIVAIDADPEMVKHAIKAVHDTGISDVKVLHLRAEKLDKNLGSFRLATFGASFHWMDRQRVGQLLTEILEPAGHLVLICPAEFQSGTTPWEMKIQQILKEWLGPERRAGGGVYRRGQTHEQILAQMSFENIQIANIPIREIWTIEQIIGYLFSTSYASPHLLEANKEPFAKAIRERLRHYSSAETFEKVSEYAVISARPPRA